MTHQDPNQPPEQQQSQPGQQNWGQQPPPGQQSWGQQPPPGQQSWGQQPPPGQQNWGQQPPPGQPYGGYPAAPGYAQPAQTDPAGRVLDNASGLYLPPGTELASVGRRIGAYFLAIPLAVVTLGIGYLIWGLILWGQGTTPALKVLGMKVYRVDNGTVPTFGRMALREIVGRIVDSVLSVITLLISFIMMATGDKRQSLHDLVASTTVLYDPKKVLG